ncbi:MAG: CHC2 zinc finger domain-containing protein [Candidatus Symbiobacter sp.]|nr:CHC2 zinc finger domain-containing protein [Candidatus Symbiobacter sp.]
MSFPPEFMAELRRRNPISQVVARRVKLVKKGREFQGLCPFHTEKSPSFTVNDDKEFYHCFGCGAHGDAISFLTEIERMSFPEAVEFLAQASGVAMPRDEYAARSRPRSTVNGAAAPSGVNGAAAPSGVNGAAAPSGINGSDAAAPPGTNGENPPDATPRDQAGPPEISLEKMRAALNAAMKWYESELKGQDGAAAREYLRQRGVTDATIAQFSLGFAPDRWGGLVAALTAQGHRPDVMLACGLLVESAESKKRYEKFRGRIMFPIFDRQGRVIGFGGRAMGDAKPKYLNSPDTPLFHKGKILYAHHLARAAAKSSPIVVAEGYLDVISLHQNGFAGAVAPLGTALTEEQLTLLWRLNPEPLLCFDGDDAGHRAAHRAAVRALPSIGPGKSLRFLDLPKGRDPDEILQTPGGVALIKQIIAAAMPLADKLFHAECEAEPLLTPENKAGLRQRLRDHARAIGDADTRHYYEQHFMEKISALFGAKPREGAGFSQAASSFARGGLRLISRAGFELVNGMWVPVNSRLVALTTKPKIAQKTALRIELLEKPLLACLLNYPELGQTLIEPVANIRFSNADLTNLAQDLLHILALEPDIDRHELTARLEDQMRFPLIHELLLPFSRFNHLEILNPALDIAEREIICMRLLAQIDHEGMARERDSYVAAFIDSPDPEIWRHLMLLAPMPVTDDG